VVDDPGRQPQHAVLTARSASSCPVLLVVEAAVMVMQRGLPFWHVARCNGSRPVSLRLS
jgi:hypothetical protein